MTHEKKLRLARTMLKPIEIKMGITPFQSQAWFKRSAARRAKELAKFRK